MSKKLELKCPMCNQATTLTITNRHYADGREELILLCFGCYSEFKVNKKIVDFKTLQEIKEE